MIHQKIKDTLTKELPHDSKNLSFNISQSKIEGFDYQSNIAFMLTKLWKKSPLDCATLVCDNIESSNFSFKVSGPGFINIKVLDNAFQDIIKDLPSFSEPRAQTNTKVIVDYSSPNVAKEFHVGHLRSTVIGDCLANALEWLGHDVLRLNHIGDWGTAFGMLIAHIKEYHLERVLAGQFDMSDMMIWYRESKKRFDDDKTFYTQSKKEVVLLQSGDHENVSLWKNICTKSQEAYDEIYDLLNIKSLNVRGESFYNSMLDKVIAHFDEKQLIRNDSGAKCLFLDGFLNRDNEPLPLIIQKSDGGYNYATTDLAALSHRFTIEKAHKVFYVTDSGQREHFKMIFAAGLLGGYINDISQVQHVPFGLVLDKSKKKFKTRSGDTIKLIDLLDEGVKKAKNIAVEKNIDNPDNFSKIVGIGAIKYADLCNNKINDYVFDFDRMLAFEGNTIVYILYAFVRVHSLKTKLSYNNDQTRDELQYAKFKFDKYERRLLLSLSLFPSIIEKLAQDQCPHYLTEYLYDLSNDFHSFFQHCHIKGHPESKKRLWIAHHVSIVIKMGLEILGCDVIYEM